MVHNFALSDADTVPLKVNEITRVSMMAEYSPACLLQMHL